MNELARIPAAEPTSFKARFTTAEFLRMGAAGAFVGMKIELVDGELERMPPPMSRHAVLQASIVFLLSTTGRQGVVVGEVGIDLGDDSLLGCDAALLREPVDENRMLRPADLLLTIEIAVTTLARDTDMKASKYAAAGIQTYWIVDAEGSVVHVHTEPRGGTYAQIRTVRFGEPLAVPGSTDIITLN